jgi:nucleotide-binding universal stress UspA family protein
MFAPKKILVPTDFSKFSDKALKQAVDIATQYNSTIYLVHVTGIMKQCSADYCIDQATMDQIEKNGIESSQDMLQKQVKRAVKAKDVHIISEVKEGVPYEEIVKEQEAKKVDLIVIASHGRTGLLSHLIGSVAEKVARSATCLVLLVRVH